LALIVPLALVTVMLSGCKQKNENPQEPSAEVGVKVSHQEPPLLLEEPPLLLEEGNTQELPPAEGPVADNSRCHVCHINYADEELAVRHARANIGCEQCHGACDAHCSDEDNVTPPDVMYPRTKINSSCMMCHPKEKIETETHRPILDGAATENKYCTDCHGEHRLGYRTRRWDKNTGELLEDDKVRMTTDQMLREN
jgi:hypothetical protein